MIEEIKTLMIKKVDNVAMTLSNIPKGTEIDVKCQGEIFHISIQTDIKFGHKFAVKPIKQGEDIIKYGEVIGAAVIDIDPGMHVHVHNIEGKRGRGDKLVNQGN